MAPEPSSAPLRLQQLVGAAERLARRTPTDANRPDWLALVEQARDRLAQRPFVPLPLDAFVLVDNGKERIVASARPADRIIEEALVPILNRALEPALLPCVHGYRPGRSTVTAAAEASQAVGAGRRSIALLDVADYYGSIDREILRAKLAALLAPSLVELLHALICAPLCLRGEMIRPSLGIPLGRAVSPPLANAYAVDLDAEMQGHDVAYLRYADDIFIAARTPEERDAAEARLGEALARLALRVRHDKTRRFCFDGSPFVYLGHTVDDRGVYERITGARLERLTRAIGPRRDAPPDGAGTSPHEADAGECFPSLRQHTLYVTEPGLYLRTSQGLVIVQRGKDVVREIPLHRLDRVLILAGASFSSGFVSGCVYHGIPVLFFVGKGKAYGSLVSGGMPNPLRLRAQYDLVADPHRRLALARAIVDAKLSAMLRRLANANAELAEAARERIRQTHAALHRATDAESLRGYEGAATKAYYEGFATRIRRQGFELHGRTRRPPRDPINSLLSFAYSLLFGEMQTVLLAHGLDPHPGVLHDLHRNHPALASDLIEPYRILVADSFVLALVNNRQVAPDGFERHATGGVYMTRDTSRVVLAAYESFMDRPSGGGRGSGSPRLLIDAAARAMLRVVLGETDDLVLPLADRLIDNQTNPDSPPDTEEPQP
ncbi:MAG: CRISPR-associated endonuclease Cas1 [Micrococcales bacterium]|nr:CRISPR-associated endonuclease Cas1 [Micrococcales bacterium]